MTTEDTQKKEHNFDFTLPTASWCNEARIKKSLLCACYTCNTCFRPKYVWDWINDEPAPNRTAICPNCGIDSVISLISMEEFNKRLTGNHPSDAIEELCTKDILFHIIPDLEEMCHIPQTDDYLGDSVWDHTMAVLEEVQSNKLEIRMAALLHDIGKTVTLRLDYYKNHEKYSRNFAEQTLKLLGYEKSFVNEVVFLIRHHMYCKKWGDHCERMEPKILRNLQYLCKTEERFRNLMLLIDADNKAQESDTRLLHQVDLILQCTEEMKANGSDMFGYKLPFTGRDVMEIKGIQPGPEVRECLDYLLKLAMVNPLRDKDEFIKHLKGYRLKAAVPG